MKGLSIHSVPVAIQRRIPGLRRRTARANRRLRAASACFAPTTQLHLLPWGEIRACCLNSHALGNISEERLPEIWNGHRRAAMRLALAANVFPPGCEGCGVQVEVEGRANSYPEVFDFWVEKLDGDLADNRWPIRMEFNLSNSCNLQCIQCNGELSSSIRVRREGRPPMPKVYDDQFFEDLRAFLPHLRHANFAGGEPFLGAENFVVWKQIAQLAPDLDVTINTNATVWNRRVERVLNELKCSFIFSLDGISKQTYESIRVDGDFEAVMYNINRFITYGRKRKTALNINHCLMPQNFHEFADLLLWAEERHIFVSVSVVRSPEHCSIGALPKEEIADIHRFLESRSAHLMPRLRLNWPTWEKEIQRIGRWAGKTP